MKPNTTIKSSPNLGWGIKRTHLKKLASLLTALIVLTPLTTYAATREITVPLTKVSFGSQTCYQPMHSAFNPDVTNGMVSLYNNSSAKQMYDINAQGYGSVFTDGNLLDLFYSKNLKPVRAHIETYGTIHNNEANIITRDILKAPRSSAGGTTSVTYSLSGSAFQKLNSDTLSATIPASTRGSRDRWNSGFVTLTAHFDITYASWVGDNLRQIGPMFKDSISNRALYPGGVNGPWFEFYSKPQWAGYYPPAEHRMQIDLNKSYVVFEVSGGTAVLSDADYSTLKEVSDTIQSIPTTLNNQTNQVQSILNNKPTQIVSVPKNNPGPTLAKLGLPTDLTVDGVYTTSYGTRVQINFYTPPTNIDQLNLS